MNLDTDASFVAHDQISTSIPSTNDGVTADGHFEWDNAATIDADSVPSQYRAFFDTESFHRFDDVVVTKTIPQQYTIHGDTYTFKKHPDALKDAAWTLENRPYVLEHPNTEFGTVDSLNLVHGFWKNATHDDAENETTASLYFPTNDDDVKEYLADSGDVSVGFYNRVTPAEDDGFDGWQTDIIYDHVASVKHGRCSGEDGCGIPQNRLHRLADAEDRTEFENDSEKNNTNTMSGCDCDNDDDVQFDFGLDDMSIDYLADTHDDVAQLRESKDELEEKVEDLQTDADELSQVREHLTTLDSVDDDADPSDAAEALVSEFEEMKTAYDEYVSDRSENLRGALCEHTEYDEDELLDMSLDALENAYDAAEKAGAFEDTEAEATPTMVEDSVPAGTNDDEGGSGKQSREIDLYDQQY